MNKYNTEKYYDKKYSLSKIFNPWQYSALVKKKLAVLPLPS